MERRYRYVANGVADTIRLAETVEAGLEAGAVLALDGDLGAGKTRFSQALAKSLGIPGIVNSPTFTIIKEYEGGRLPLYHMDVYRITLEEADDLGLEEYFYGEGVTVVEWASRIEPILPTERLTIYIHDRGGEERLFELTPSGEACERLCMEMKENGWLYEHDAE
ncbi:tRNA (adenosine(37)-N6)-threonylcarbamoyltransferase complex ATPase subunit type 1 TsaE [Paenibacillus koleovorans]|uniref:tRNA (adenosine(37)-N6)-threonylcarbamoyltransferase complex ATPase subunit type 1 TsaE n=1 Tax=Paenibacillus koleovorans TaxID=121608 RepID=UPI000FDA30FF|nr:tRNA (adenosine(37)-N6)-threonylcarbamoyltransferase complex ATPase subunit type 1 TsaE [Paenibacillus koleovorans]